MREVNGGKKGKNLDSVYGGFDNTNEGMGINNKCGLSKEMVPSVNERIHKRKDTIVLNEVDGVGERVTEIRANVSYGSGPNTSHVEGGLLGQRLRSNDREVKSPTSVRTWKKKARSDVGAGGVGVPINLLTGKRNAKGVPAT